MAIGVLDETGMDEEEAGKEAETGIEVEVPGIEIEAVEIGIEHQAVKRKNNKIIENEAVNDPKVEKGRRVKVLMKEEGGQKVQSEAVEIDKSAFLQLKKIQNIQMNHQ